ncbi:MAG: hypothetical protein L6Q29_04020, partial [Candidatus Pacebacteria bacterium]|nr:hypothetical protein [Candidatus Paceibacterota bacterium]
FSLPPPIKLIQSNIWRRCPKKGVPYIVGECFEYKVGKGECKTEVVSSFALLSRQEAERKLIGKISEVMEKQSAMGKTEQIESV